MGLFHKHPTGIAHPRLVNILIVKIHLYLTIMIWRGQVFYLIVFGNKTNYLRVKPVDPAHETAMYIPTMVD